MTVSSVQNKFYKICMEKDLRMMKSAIRRECSETDQKIFGFSNKMTLFINFINFIIGN